MRRIIYLTLSFVGVISFLTACNDFGDINKDPNSPQKVPTQSLISNVQKKIMNAVRSTTLSIGGTNLYVQWFANNTYTDADRYYWISTTGNTVWTNLYLAQNNLDEIIRLNTDEESRMQAALNGVNQNQIAASRILKVWTYQIMTDSWGDIPYNSYAGQNPTFDAGMAAEGIIYPQYASQQEIYKDMLNELKEASLQLDLNQLVFKQGDAIYHGNALKWKKFANSLSLRIANRVRHKLPEADARMKEIIDHPSLYPLLENNHDNATLAYEPTAPNQAPFYTATVLANRNDYAVSNVLIDFLKGQRAPFNSRDPRLALFAQPNVDGEYVGQSYGLDMYTASLVSPDKVSKPGIEVYKSDYHEVLMEYAELQFILSEYKGWDEQHYQNGIRASMQKWNVPESSIDAYLSTVLPATAETVYTQKWVALFLQGNEAWSEYRRTGYPSFLIKKGDAVWTGTVNGQVVTKYFDPIAIDAIPSRLLYPNSEIQLNKEQYRQAVVRQGSDALTTSIWWNK